MKLRCGTRGSSLALAQTNLFLDSLKDKNPDLQVEIRRFTTIPDKKQEIPLHSFNGQGVFVRELEDALLQDEIDFAVHSLKDLPSVLHPKLELACVPNRGALHDVFYSPKYSTIADLPPQASIGTGSFRRRAQLLRIRQDIKVSDIRGNVDTRIKKVNDSKYDAIILAEAGVRRLNLFNDKFKVLDFEHFIPAIGQGALGIETRKDDSTTISTLKIIEDPKTRDEVIAERYLAHSLGAGCQTPLGAMALTKLNELHLKARLYSVNGEICLEVEGSGSIKTREYLGQKLGLQLLRKAEEYPLSLFNLSRE